MAIINKTKTEYSTGEVASILGLPRRTLTKYCSEGKIKAVQNPISKTWKIRQQDLVGFMTKFGLTTLKTPAKPKILIVDDEASVILTITEILERAGGDISIDSTTDGFDALIKIGAEMPDLIILDVHMPGTDGKDILRAIKKGEITRDIKVIVITGYPDKMDVMLELGAEEALAKPFDTGHLLQVVKKLLPASVKIKSL